MSIIYEKSDDVIEITIRDATMRKVGTWKFNTADRELGAGILRHIQRKYGFSPTIKPNEHITNKDKPKSFLDESCDW